MTRTEGQPEACTGAYADYYVSSRRLVGANMFILQLSTAYDNLDQSIDQATDLPPARTNDAAHEDTGQTKRMFEAYKKHLPVYLEASYCRAVDNFLTFVTGILSIVFRAKPETMRSNHTVKTSEVLQHPTMSDFVDYLAEDTVHRLSYQGFGDLNDWTAERIGFPLVVEGEELKRIVRIVEWRNLLVHNRGVVNKVFVRRIGREYQEGERLDLSVQSMTSDLNCVDRSALDIEKRAQAKFDLPAPITFEQVCERLAEYGIVIEPSEAE